ncbi:rubrerythrin family protein [Wansuia hejianensis]|uniref:Rubrerythrin-2 n=1 Tax=Wansuia hejianensis TaxID=2763667 RepID=A0A926F1W3_9FIRM|nr:ferritin family protein [Wansuia hejianensis]MBC8591527.1 Rubrerythrin-2 [Wansuia hejianensis]
MNAMTQDNLRSAFGGESMAHMRYRIWGEKAEKEGFPTVARLFKCTADAEEVHATLHFEALRDINGDFPVTSMAGFGLTNTSENLQGAIDGETFEFTQMYPAYIAVAEMQGEKSAVRAMKYAIEAEKVHAELFTKAKEAVDGGKDLEVKTMLLCPICGYISLTGEEDNCPLCNAKKELFISY